MDNKPKFIFFEKINLKKQILHVYSTDLSQNNQYPKVFNNNNNSKIANKYSTDLNNKQTLNKKWDITTNSKLRSYFSDKNLVIYHKDINFFIKFEKLFSNTSKNKKLKSLNQALKVEKIENKYQQNKIIVDRNTLVNERKIRFNETKINSKSNDNRVIFGKSSGNVNQIGREVMNSYFNARTVKNEENNHIEANNKEGNFPLITANNFKHHSDRIITSKYFVTNNNNITTTEGNLLKIEELNKGYGCNLNNNRFHLKTSNNEETVVASKKVLLSKLKNRVFKNIYNEGELYDSNTFHRSNIQINYDKLFKI